MSDKLSSRKISTSVIWSYFERSANQIVGFIVSIILARILVPDDFGLVAIVTIFISICELFVVNGFGSALIQKKDADELDFSSVFFVSLFISIVMYLALFIFSGNIADYFDIAQLKPILRLMGITIPVSAVTSIQSANLSRKLEFKKAFIATASATVVSAAVGIYMALNGNGVWALVIQQFLNKTITMIMLTFLSSWKLIFKLSFSRIKSLFSFGWKLLFTAIVGKLYEEVRSFLIGKKFSSADLAYFNRGKQFPQILVANINDSIQKVSFPLLSIAQEDENYSLALQRKVISTSMYVLSPIIVGLAVVAHPMVRVILTDKWLEAVPYIWIFCAMFLFQPFHTGTIQSINAKGRSDIYLKIGLTRIAFDIILLLIAVLYFRTVPAIAISAAIEPVLVTLLYAYVNKKMFKYRYTEQLHDVFLPVLLSVVMGIVVYIVSYIKIGTVYYLALQILTGILVYILLSFVFKIKAFKDVLILLKALKRK